MPRADRWLLVLVAILAAVAVPTPATGNMAAPPEPRTVRVGRSVGEPGGALRAVVVSSERLVIDLRPLADQRPARVQASYRLRNAGPAIESLLWFVADGLVPGEHGVWLDGEALLSAPVTDAVLPEEWRAPASTPAPGGGDPLPYRAGGERVIGFRVRIAPGDHELRVVYPAAASAFQDGGLMPVWQLGYVLAPARAWGGFGDLEARVELPRGWSAAASPTMKRDGDALLGRWRGIPADALALAVRAPAPATGWRYALVALGGLVGLVGLRWCGRRMGGALGRRGRSGAWAALAAVPLAIVLAMGVMVALLAVPGWVAASAGPLVNQYRISAMSYGSGMLLILVFPLAVLFGFLAVLIPALLAVRRTRAVGGG